MPRDETLDLCTFATFFTVPSLVQLKISLNLLLKPFDFLVGHSTSNHELLDVPRS
jgi:hypothetical protein